MAALRTLRTLRDRRMSRLPLYEEITPSTSWTDSDNGRNLIIDIPGFKMEEVNIEIGEFGNVTIKGRHDVGNNRFRRFSMTVKAPENTDMKRIVGNIEGGLYTVVFPKMEEPEVAEPEKKQQLDADELDEKREEGIDAALCTEPANTTEKVATESLTEAGIHKTETAERSLETGMPETEKAHDKIATEKPEVLETSADQEPLTISKPLDTSAARESETATKGTETASCVLKSSATNTLSEMSKAEEREVQAPAHNNTAEVLQMKTVKFATKDERKEDQVVTKDGGFLENVMELIIDHKACIISAILAFSMGILISRKINP